MGDSHSGSKAKDGEKKKERRKRRDRTMVITMASYALQTPPRVAHAKPPGPTHIGMLRTQEKLKYKKIKKFNLNIRR